MIGCCIEWWCWKHLETIILYLSLFLCVCLFVSAHILDGEPERKMRRAKVIYSYVAQCEDELSLGLGKVSAACYVSFMC